jgi:hypothetical protein
MYFTVLKNYGSMGMSLIGQSLRLSYDKGSVLESYHTFAPQSLERSFRKFHLVVYLNSHTKYLYGCMQNRIFNSNHCKRKM